MVKLDLVQSSNATLAASQPLVAVFVGGTSNIGANTIRSLAAAHGEGGKGLRAYIIGRNAKAAEKVIFDCQKVCPTGQFFFIRANDLALIKDVDLVCAELIKSEEKEASTAGNTPRIDILVMTQGIFKPWDPRNETSEGLDTFMSLLYYSRMRFITLLLPLLLSSSLPARVISVYAPGRDTNFISTQNAGRLALVHYYPGLVLSDGFQDPSFPFWFRAIFKYAAPLIRLAPMTLGEKENGERTLFNASSRFPPRQADGKPASSSNTSEGAIGVAESSDGIMGGGAYRVNYDSEQAATPKQYEKLREEGWLDKVVKHTSKAFEEIVAGRVFKE